MSETMSSIRIQRRLPCCLVTVWDADEAVRLSVTIVSGSDGPVGKVAFDHRGGTRCHE
jgi:hypothetical protein